jgi:hypothetical protein
MNTKQSGHQAEIHILASQIGRLDLDEHDAIRRRDWSAARNIVLERAPLKEVRQRSAAPKQR